MLVAPAVIPRQPWQGLARSLRVRTRGQAELGEWLVSVQASRGVDLNSL